MTLPEAIGREYGVVVKMRFQVRKPRLKVKALGRRLRWYLYEFFCSFFFDHDEVAYASLMHTHLQASGAFFRNSCRVEGRGFCLLL